MQNADFNIMGDNTDGMDRISELPPFIIHHVMSYLFRDEVARTSILSKKWNHLRNSFPILDFDQTDFFRSDSEVDSETEEEDFDERFYERLVDFAVYVSVALLRFCELKFRMQKLRIFINLLDPEVFSTILDIWIGAAVESEVKRLDFDIQTDRDRLYTLPQTIFSAKSITTLNFGGCKLEPPSGPVNFCFLKRLTLDNVYINDQMVQNFTSECTLLDELYFRYCWGMKCFCISKSLKLKVLHILKFNENYLESIKIAVPSLQQFTLVFERQQKAPCMIDLDGFPHLIDLKLVGGIFKDQEFHYFISKFPLHEKLFLQYCFLLERVTISSNRIKKVLIAHCNNLKAIDVEALNLVCFGYLFNPFPISSINIPCLWKILCNYEDADDHWFLNIKKFLRASRQNCDLTIYVLSIIICLQVR